MANLRIKELRISKNIQQKALAELLGVSPRTIRIWESGKYEPSIDQLISIANILGVSIDYLVGRTDKK
ncbi:MULTISPECIES: helix-turn-helix domain-containing protein [Enterococcus]|uniref:helix-turn-helix domain-containing protein n=1 Tax=Enterococcus TaxID=1350 RepID=UPI0015594428|nr:helix-turn-helix transcriptional regulator [Enterococcus gallinarum]MDT2714314.1 helix-turn-helix transcriptional regulator [Enterococcus gallinarum]NQE03132.1 helix-turn-helix transcriptional regulator [Enterococcus gallinarum]